MPKTETIEGVPGGVLPGPAGTGAAVEGRRYAGASPEERITARRQRFIEAGIQLFGTQGFRSTTVRGICAEAGLTDRYFYESFDNLEALLTAVYRTLMDDLRGQLVRHQQAAQPVPGDAAMLERITTEAYDIWFEMLSDPRVARIVMREMLGVSREVDALYDERTRDFAELTVAPLAALPPLSGLPPARRSLVGRALVGASIHVAAAWIHDEGRTARQDAVRTCVHVALGTLRALEQEASIRTDAPVRSLRPHPTDRST